MNNDVKFMLWVMNPDNCPDKTKRFCHVCDRRELCDEEIV